MNFAWTASFVSTARERNKILLRKYVKLVRNLFNFNDLLWFIYTESKLIHMWICRMFLISFEILILFFCGIWIQKEADLFLALFLSSSDTTWKKNVIRKMWLFDISWLRFLRYKKILQWIKTSPERKFSDLILYFLLNWRLLNVCRVILFRLIRHLASENVFSFTA